MGKNKEHVSRTVIKSHAACLALRTPSCFSWLRWQSTVLRHIRTSHSKSPKHVKQHGNKVLACPLPGKKNKFRALSSSSKLAVLVCAPGSSSEQPSWQGVSLVLSGFLSPSKEFPKVSIGLPFQNHYTKGLEMLAHCSATCFVQGSLGRQALPKPRID